MNKKEEIREPVVRSMPWDGAQMSREVLLNREWLVTNGLGGYASGTIAGAMTRRYHGLLIAALPAPMGRVVTLSHLSARIRSRDGQLVLLDTQGPEGNASSHTLAALVEFRLESGLPVWRYEAGGLAIEK